MAGTLPFTAEQSECVIALCGRIFCAGWDACLAHTQDQNSTLKWALRRAIDWLEKLPGPTMLACDEVLKILTDNGLEYDSDGRLVERKADAPDTGGR